MKDPAAAWHHLAHKLCRKVNLAHCLDRSAVPMVIAASIAAAAVLVIRNHWTDHAGLQLAFAAAALPLATLTAVWCLSRRSFISVEQALVRLEMQLGLHAALSTAEGGAGPWPQVPAYTPDGLRWNWLRATIPPMLALGLVATAWFLPVSNQSTRFEMAEPASWNVVESDLSALIERELVDESTTQKTRKAIEALRERPQDEWFDHSSIEAGDRILQTHQRDMTDLEKRLRDAAQSLRQAASARQGLETARPAANSEFSDILNELGMGQLTPNRELMEQLEKLRESGESPFSQLDPRQMAELLDNIENNAQELEKMLEKYQDMLKSCGNCGTCGQCGGGNGEGNAEGDKNGPGQGAPKRGPGEGGSLFGDARDNVDSSLHQPLPAGDLSRAAPGDMIGTGETEHDIDPGDSPALRSGGAPTQAGDGGGAAWSDSLLPSEQQALKRYFD